MIWPNEAVIRIGLWDGGGDGEGGGFDGLLFGAGGRNPSGI
jgi:hypothetical protein